MRVGLRTTAAVDLEIAKKVEEYREEHDLTLAAFMERAIVSFFNGQPESPESKTEEAPIIPDTEQKKAPNMESMLDTEPEAESHFGKNLFKNL